MKSKLKILKAEIFPIIFHDFEWGWFKLFNCHYIFIFWEYKFEFGSW